MKRCKICGGTEEDHHTPEWIETPDGCVCDPCDWMIVGPVCGKYEGDGEEYCKKCEHDKECHKS